MFQNVDVEEMDQNLAYPLPELNKDQLLTVERIMADLLHTPEAPRYSVPFLYKFFEIIFDQG